MPTTTPNRKPSKTDVSRPGKTGDYAFKKGFYQDAEVAADYDFHRWGSPKRARRNLKHWRCILSALEMTEGVRTVLDLPCGTGRFTGSLASLGYDVIGSDISSEMMKVAVDKQQDEPERALGFLQADAERLPLRTGSVDCVVSICFMFHIDPTTRVRILREMRRVSRKWLVIDYRHRYSLRFWMWKLKTKLGLVKEPLPRVSRREMEEEFREAGLKVLQIIPVARFFSDKWVVLAAPQA